MKLTADMFDFEKYDYHLYWAGGLKPGVEVFNINAQRWAEQVYPGDSYNRAYDPSGGEPVKRWHARERGWTKE